MSLQLATICLEALICLISLWAIIRGKKYMFGFLVAFGIYLYRDLGNLYGLYFKILEKGSLPLLLLIAAAFSCWAVWRSYKD